MYFYIKHKKRSIPIVFSHLYIQQRNLLDGIIVHFCVTKRWRKKISLVLNLLIASASTAIFEQSISFFIRLLPYVRFFINGGTVALCTASLYLVSSLSVLFVSSVEASFALSVLIFLLIGIVFFIIFANVFYHSSYNH